MKCLLYALAGIMVFTPQVMGANSAPADCISKMQSLSAALRVFRAEFDVVDDKIALPKEFTDAELQHELSLLDEQAKRQPGTEQEKFQTEKRKEMAMRHAREAAVTASQRYRAVLYVKGNYIRWEEPKLVLSYNGKKATVFLTRPNPQPGYISSARILPTFDLVTSQFIP